MQATRPYIHLNAALDARGCHHGKISSPEDLARVHAHREAYDAVAVGANTYAVDNPRLTARPEHLGRAPRRQPQRVVLVGETAIDDPVGGAPLLAIGPTRPRNANRWEPCPPRDIVAATAALAHVGIRTLLLEGGPTLWRAALDAGVVDLLTVWIADADPVRAAALVRAHLALPPSLAVRATALGGGQLVRARFPTPVLH